MNLEPMNTGYSGNVRAVELGSSRSVSMGSGFAPMARPGMTGVEAETPPNEAQPSNRMQCSGAKDRVTVAPSSNISVGGRRTVSAPAGQSTMY